MLQQVVYSYIARLHCKMVNQYHIINDTAIVPLNMECETCKKYLSHTALWEAPSPKHSNTRMRPRVQVGTPPSNYQKLINFMWMYGKYRSNIQLEALSLWYFRQTDSIKIFSTWKIFMLISAFIFLSASKLRALYAHLHSTLVFFCYSKKTEKPNCGMAWAHPWGQHGHLQGNFRPRIAARRQREVMATMVLQEKNGHEVVVGRTDTGTGGSGTGHASLHRASAERKRMAIWFPLN
jgi:hypothetical protein